MFLVGWLVFLDRHTASPRSTKLLSMDRGSQLRIFRLSAKLNTGPTADCREEDTNQTLVFQRGYGVHGRGGGTVSWGGAVAMIGLLGQSTVS